MPRIHVHVDVDNSRKKAVADFTSELLKRNDQWESKWAAAPDWHLALQAGESADADWIQQRALEISESIVAAALIQAADAFAGEDPIGLDEVVWQWES